MTRTVCLWCPDWPVVSLRRARLATVGVPVVVLDRGRVRAASVEARAGGVRQGMRKREAEACCPGLEVAETDESLEARVFESVARALDDVTARLALVRPGLLSFPARGPARYFGGDEAVAAHVSERVAGAVDDARVGVADSAFAAELAARRTPETGVLVLRPGETAAFLAEQPVTVLRGRGLGALAQLLARLGIRTLGDLTALPEAAVSARFGAEGLTALGLARGDDVDPPTLVDPPRDLSERVEFDPPAARVDAAAFAAKAAADRLLGRCERRGLACTRVMVEAETEHGERLSRLWRHDGALTPGALTQRVRWQLEAWISGDPSVGSRQGGSEGYDSSTSGGLTLLLLVPDEVMPASGQQLEFWGADPRAADRAARAFARLQGMLGHHSVVVPVPRGGRTPAEQVAWVPWGDPRPHAGEPAADVPPWPGSVPPPAPARVFDPPLPAELLDVSGKPVGVSGRGEVSAPPVRLECERVGGRVEWWGGPWVHDVRWWDAAEHRRRALFQVVAVRAEGTRAAVLVAIEGGRATVEALYD